MNVSQINVIPPNVPSSRGTNTEIKELKQQKAELKLFTNFSNNSVDTFQKN